MITYSNVACSSDGLIIYVSIITSSQATINKSLDSGNTWTLFQTFENVTNISCLVCNSTGSNILMSYTQNSLPKLSFYNLNSWETYIHTYSINSCFITDNVTPVLFFASESLYYGYGIDIWQEILDGQSTYLTVKSGPDISLSSGYIYCSDSNKGINYSVNGINGLFSRFEMDQVIYNIAIPKLNQNYFYAAVGTIFYFSNDINNGRIGVAGLANIFTDASGIYSSSDGSRLVVSNFTNNIQNIQMGETIEFSTIQSSQNMTTLVGNFNVTKIYALNNSFNSINNPITACLNEGTLILTINGYVKIEELKIGDFVETQKGYIKIKEILSNFLIQKNEVYLIPKNSINCFPFEDLYISKLHCLLLKNDLEFRNQKWYSECYDYMYKIENYNKLHVFHCNKAIIAEGKFKLYHLVLESNNIFEDFLISANGLYVESCSINNYLSTI